MMLPARLTAWRAMYETKLADAVKRHPSQYRNANAKRMADGMAWILATEGLHACVINAAGWKASAKAFGISNTYAAWEDWLAGTLTPVPID